MRLELEGGGVLHAEHAHTLGFPAVPHADGLIPGARNEQVGIAGVGRKAGHQLSVLLVHVYGLQLFQVGPCRYVVEADDLLGGVGVRPHQALTSHHAVRVRPQATQAADELPVGGAEVAPWCISRVDVICSNERRCGLNSMLIGNAPEKQQVRARCHFHAAHVVGGHIDLLRHLALLIPDQHTAVFPAADEAAPCRVVRHGEHGAGVPQVGGVGDEVAALRR
mmetsp:Transcript_31131/g.69193  ORF Transcript_31131/g.69193 Transcript_31131/m.69193 type:complete len:222 (+) Transcript_31131:741-1406(+)